MLCQDRTSRVALVALVVLLVTSAETRAAEELVTQRNLQFQQDGAKVTALAIKPGDTLLFRNDDRFAHNVFSRTAGFEFDLGTMRTGASGARTFSQPGTLDVECALHPQMKFRLTVAP